MRRPSRQGLYGYCPTPTTGQPDSSPVRKAFLASDENPANLIASIHGSVIVPTVIESVQYWKILTVLLLHLCNAATPQEWARSFNRADSIALPVRHFSTGDRSIEGKVKPNHPLRNCTLRETGVIRANTRPPTCGEKRPRRRIAGRKHHDFQPKVSF